MQEIKTSVQMFMADFLVRKSRPAVLVAKGTALPVVALSKQLLQSLQSGTMHWRSVVLAHTWFAIVLPSRFGEVDLAAQVFKIQLQHAVGSQMVVVKVCSESHSWDWVGDHELKDWESVGCKHGRSTNVLRQNTA
jgi:hypothetical protein